jgi:hypothetical protein
MNTPISIRMQRPFHARSIAPGKSLSNIWRAVNRKLFPVQVVGNPLHEAWTVEGEPIERMTPQAMAKASTSQHLVLPHNRGR